MAEQDKVMSNDGVSRRSFLGKTSAALAAAASLPILAAAQQTKDMSGDTHTGDQRAGVGAEEPGSGGAGAGFGVSAGRPMRAASLRSSTPLPCRTGASNRAAGPAR